MNWPLLLALIVAVLIAAFIRLRVEPRRARLVNWLFIYPGGLVLLYYAWFRGFWLEVLVAIVVGTLLIAGWWITYGSYLPVPTSDNISVWGQEAKKPTVAEAQAEVERLKAEKTELEKELERMKKEKK